MRGPGQAYNSEGTTPGALVTIPHLIFPTTLEGMCDLTPVFKMTNLRV